MTLVIVQMDTEYQEFFVPPGQIDDFPDEWNAIMTSLSFMATSRRRVSGGYPHMQ